MDGYATLDVETSFRRFDKNELQKNLNITTTNRCFLSLITVKQEGFL